jgi:ribosomal protein S18 acetylase RimI-like enzyme
MEREIGIRRYRAGDREPVRRLHDVAMHGAGIHLGEGPWYEDLDEIENSYLHNGGEFLVGTLGEEVVAMGAVKKTTDDRAEIKYMRVAPKFQRRGFGQVMLTALERRAVELGYTTLHLDTAVRQKAARRLYEGNGYREARRGKKGALDCVFYEKRVRGVREAGVVR